MYTVEIPGSVAAAIVDYDTWRPLCLLPNATPWTQEAIDDERARIAELSVVARRAPWRALARGTAASLLVGAFAGVPLHFVLDLPVAESVAAAAAAVTAVYFPLAAMPFLLGFHSARPEHLQDVLEALAPLSDERAADGQLARIVGELYTIDDPDMHDYRAHQKRLREMERPITRLECLDLIRAHQREVAAGARERQRASDRAVIEALHGQSRLVLPPL
jgi:hypothetical protein